MVIGIAVVIGIAIVITCVRRMRNRRAKWITPIQLPDSNYTPQPPQYQQNEGQGGEREYSTNPELQFPFSVPQAPIRAVSAVAPPNYAEDRMSAAAPPNYGEFMSTKNTNS